MAASELHFCPSSLPLTIVVSFFVSLQAHFIMDEMISNGFVVETNKSAILAPIELLNKFT